MTFDLEGRYMDAAYDKTFEGTQEDFSEMGITVGTGIRVIALDDIFAGL